MSTSGEYRARERLLGYDEELLDKRILLVGAGALGSAVQHLLAMWGFRRGWVVDCDHYEPSNAARVADFPFEKVLAGERVSKAEHVAALWRRRLSESGDTSDAVTPLLGYAQEIPPQVLRSTDLVISAVDHPRARYDVALLARRYGKPLVTGGFDGISRGASVTAIPGEASLPCLACFTPAPSYAASDTSCTALGKRALERRKLPATPALATLCAGLLVQTAVDGLAFGFAATMTKWTSARFSREGAPGLLGDSVATRSPDCAHHRKSWAPLLLPTSPRTLGELFGALDELGLEQACLSLPATLPIHALSDEEPPTLLRVARPPWRCPSRLTTETLPRAPEGAYAMALDELDHQLVRRLGLSDLELSQLGLGPGARFELQRADGSTVGVEWIAPECASGS